MKSPSIWTPALRETVAVTDNTLRVAEDDGPAVSVA